MWVRILGSAAGSGVPQWNGVDPVRIEARIGAPEVEPRTQSVAISADRDAWFLLNVCPDAREEVATHPGLGPRDGVARDAAIAVGTRPDAEIDPAAGGLLLRKAERLDLASPSARDRLRETSPTAKVLDAFTERSWRELPLEGAFELKSPRPTGLYVHAFQMSSSGPRPVDAGRRRVGSAVVGLAIIDARTGGRLVYAPSVPGRNDELDALASQADCLLMDGTFWSDDEPQRFGLHRRRARDLGHWPVGGPGGSLAWVARKNARHRAYVHVNHTNPMLSRGAPERRAVEACGIGVAADGDAFEV
jgi:pyrroloquinoline quinone biosynthesis protein B